MTDDPKEPKDQKPKAPPGSGGDRLPVNGAATLVDEALESLAVHHLSVAEYGADMIWVADIATETISYANAAVERLLGFAAPAFIGRSFDEILTPDSLAEARRVLREEFCKDGLEGEDPEGRETLELEAWHAEERAVWVEITARFLRDDEGRPRLIQGTARDVTARRREERARIRASRMEATTSLAGRVAHDVNDLMTGVLGNADLLLAELELAAEGRDMLEEIRQAATTAGQLARQLQSYARGGRPGQDAVDLTQLVEDFVASERARLPDGVVVEATVTPAALLVPGNPLQLRQALANLWQNALEALACAGGRVHLQSGRVTLDGSRSRRRDDVQPGDYALLTVSDTGPGFEEEALLHGFEPFFSTRRRGRGLGLAEVFGVIVNHGGHVDLRNRPGGGAEVEVLLPLAPEAKRSVVAAAAVQQEPGDEPREPVVLVVDDEPLVQQVTQKILSRGGYRVVTAGDAEEALAIVRDPARAIDVVLLDMLLPGMSGAEALPLILEERPSLKVLLCSGYDHDERAQKALDGGAAGFVRKPYRIKDLQAAIAGILGRD